MVKNVNLTINGTALTVPEGTTILNAAKSIGIEIPTLCYLKDINEIAACRICVVEIEGYDRLVPSCDNIVEEGMVVYTHSPKVREARRVVLRLLLSQHDARCIKCTRSGNCKLQKLAEDHNMFGDRYPLDIKHIPADFSNPIIRFDDKCVKCMRCIQVCEKIQTVNVWDLVGTGSRTTVGVADAHSLGESDCTFCGQCITHCPVGALQERDNTGEVYTALADPKKITVVQVAPAVRSAWAEYFGVEATPKQMVTALKQMGFNYVFDTNFSADLTIMEEGSELLERLKMKKRPDWPMFTSCCPGWVRFLKGQYPELQANLSTTKSPQQMFGAVAKSYFASAIGADPRDIFVVSIMPCTAKKAEAALPTNKTVTGEADVDVVLTTREFVRMLRGEQVSPAHLAETEFDSPLGVSTGAAVIFGATGGVMEAALRSAYYLVTGENPPAEAFKAVRFPGAGDGLPAWDESVNGSGANAVTYASPVDCSSCNVHKVKTGVAESSFTEVFGTQPWREATFNIPGYGDLHVAAASGLGNARKLISAIRNKEAHFDFVEIMACPGGCAGGGGQPIHDGEEMALKRGEMLWQLDKDAEIRFSHENPEIQALYKNYLKEPLSAKSHYLLHTEHDAWRMPGEEEKLEGK